MDHRIPGIHHITAIAGDPQTNIDFYAGVLGLRLVKLTVNFDDPGTYHLYYGDGAGNPGTIMTFFPWAGAPRGKLGAGQVTATAFAISRESVGYWTERLAQAGVAAEKPVTRFGDEVISLTDPDGLVLELVASDTLPAVSAWDRAPVEPDHALRGFHGITLTGQNEAPTEKLLTEVMGFEAIEEDHGRIRYRADKTAPGATVDVVRAPEVPMGRVAVGSIHHAAWRTADDTSQLDWRDKLTDGGFEVSPVMDRIYFHSIYFREPGNVLFEIATDPPGFAIDEPLESLGTGLKLPPWLEGQRGQIEQAVTPVRSAKRGQSDSYPMMATTQLSNRANVAETLEGLIGNTPLIAFPHLAAHLPEGVRVYGKAEWNNPGGSIKDRSALSIIRDAEQRGLLRDGGTLLDSTSGNMGIAYAMLGAARGFRVKLVVPANASPERLMILRTYGAELELSDPAEGSDGAIRRVHEIHEAEPDKAFYANQYSNTANPQAHYDTTAPEIWEQTAGQITHFVAGLGTSGTMMGAGRRFRELNPAIRLTAFQPDSSFHGLEGLKHMPTAIVPAIYDPTLADETLSMATEEAHAMCRRLAREEGLLVGVSSGAAVAAALRVAEKLTEGVVVTILPDGASKYLSEAFWQEGN